MTRDFIKSIWFRGVVGASTILYFFLLHYLLGDDDFSVLVITLSIIAGASVIGRFGYDRSVIPVLSVLNKNGDKVAVGVLFSIALNRVFIYSFIACSVIYPLYITFVLDKELSYYFFVLAVFSSSLYSAVFVCGALLKSIGLAALASSVEGGGHYFISLIVLCLIHVLGFHVDVEVSLVVNLGSLLIMLLFGLVRSNVNYSFASYNGLVGLDNKDFYIVNLSTYLLQNIPVLALGYFQGGKEVSVYKLAERSVQVFNIINTLVNNIVASKFSTLNSERKYSELKKMYSNTVFLCSAAGVFVCIVVAIIYYAGGGSYLVYDESFLFLVFIMMFGQVLNLSFGSVGVFLATTNQHKKMRNIMLVVSLFASFFYPLAISFFGVMGGGFCYSVLLFIQNSSFYFIGVKKFKAGEA